MQRRTSIAWLDGRYAKTRYALIRKGLITFNDVRGTYELTPSGKAAAPLEKCQSCGGTGAYAPSAIGRDCCDECRGSGLATKTSPTAMSAAIAQARSAA
jgi:hypothetical protein